MKISCQLLLLVVCLCFVVLGAKAYAQDVAIIETEMVSVARWVVENTDESALIAAHDIGALGYFSQRDIVDLAGLVSPDVIPFIRNEASLETYLNAKKVDYLITFPGWYPHLVARANPEFQSGASFSLAQGGEKLTVYRWPDPEY